MILGELIEDTYRDKYDSQKRITVYENVIVAKGGDGTLIEAIHRYRNLKKPFYGVSGGTVGFMMNEQLSAFDDDDIRTIDMRLIKVKVYFRTRRGDVIFNEYKEYQAFNDICLGGDPRIWAHFDIKEKHDIIGAFSGSGVIVSTSQGSTAISKNNGGSILQLDSKLWVISGDKTDRKIDYIITPRKISMNFKSRQKVPLLIDGTSKIIDDVISLEISKGDTVKVMFSDIAEFIKKRRI